MTQPTMHHAPDDKNFCEASVKQTIALIGGKWRMLILWTLLERAYRYNELHRRIGGVSQKVLSSELKALVAAGLVERSVEPVSPPEVTYRITARGRSLEAVFTSLHAWGVTHLPPGRNHLETR